MSVGDTEEVLCANTTCEDYFPRKSFAVQLRDKDKYIEELYDLKNKSETNISALQANINW